MSIGTGGIYGRKVEGFRALMANKPHLGHNIPVKLRYAHVCETTILGHNGNISIINAFDSVYFPQLPGQITKFAFCGGFEVERDDAGRRFELIIRLVDPNGHLLNELAGELNVEPQLGELPFHNLGWGLDGQLVKEYGRYEMEVMIDQQMVCVIPILVKRADGT